MPGIARHIGGGEQGYKHHVDELKEKQEAAFAGLREEVLGNKEQREQKRIERTTKKTFQAAPPVNARQAFANLFDETKKSN